MPHLHNAMDHEHDLLFRSWTDGYDGKGYGHWFCGWYGCDYHIAIHPEGRPLPIVDNERRGRKIYASLVNGEWVFPAEYR